MPSSTPAPATHNRGMPRPSSSRTASPSTEESVIRCRGWTTTTPSPSPSTTRNPTTPTHGGRSPRRPPIRATQLHRPLSTDRPGSEATGLRMGDLVHLARVRASVADARVEALLQEPSHPTQNVLLRRRSHPILDVDLTERGALLLISRPLHIFQVARRVVGLRLDV